MPDTSSSVDLELNLANLLVLPGRPQELEDPKNGETRTHYTHGSLDMLRYKANELSKDNKITYITIDEVKEVIKDTRFEMVEELLK